jgi:type VII secretion-associated serine protease mycosin
MLIPGSRPDVERTVPTGDRRVARIVRRLFRCAAPALALAGAISVPLAAADPASADQPRQRQQWVLAALDVPAAWHITQGQGVTVAVIDSGVDPNVSDLTGSVTPGPDLTGVSTPQSNPNWGAHGTWMASLIAGHGHGKGNSDGVLGVAPRSRILSIRVITDPSDPGYHSYRAEAASRAQLQLAKAIRYAVNHKAAVISMSLGYGTSSSTVRAALLYALAHNVVVVASSGNSGASQTPQSHLAPYSFPADYPGVIGVAAVSENRQPAPFSSENLSVEVAAPGVDVPAQGRGSKYWLVSGTSPACALTAGVAALIKSRYPRLPAAEVRSAITLSASHPPKLGYDDQVGFGTVDAAAALRTAGRLARQVPDGSTPAGKAAASGHFGHGLAGVPPFPVARRGRAKLLVLLGISGACLVLLIAALWWLIAGRGRRKAATAANLAPPATPGPAGSGAGAGTGLYPTQIYPAQPYRQGRPGLGYLGQPAGQVTAGPGYAGYALPGLGPGQPPAAAGYPGQPPAAGYPGQAPAAGYPGQPPAAGYPGQAPAAGYPGQPPPATGYSGRYPPGSGSAGQTVPGQVQPPVAYTDPQPPGPSPLRPPARFGDPIAPGPGTAYPGQAPGGPASPPASAPAGGSPSQDQPGRQGWQSGPTMPSPAAPPPYQSPAPSGPAAYRDDEWLFDQDDRAGPQPSRIPPPAPAVGRRPTSLAERLEAAARARQQAKADAARDAAAAGVAGESPVAGRPERASEADADAQPAVGVQPAAGTQPDGSSPPAADPLPGAGGRASRSWAFDRPGDMSGSTGVTWPMTGPARAESTWRSPVLPASTPPGRPGDELGPASMGDPARPADPEQRAAAAHRSVWEPVVRNTGASPSPTAVEPQLPPGPPPPAPLGSSAPTWQPGLSRQPTTLRRSGPGEQSSPAAAEPATDASGSPALPKYSPSTGISRQPGDDSTPASPPPPEPAPLPRRQPQTHLAAPLRRPRPPSAGWQHAEPSQPLPSIWDVRKPTGSTEPAASSSVPESRDDQG